MRRVTGKGTIDEDVGFDLEYLTGTPTTACGTGDRWYTGIENGKLVLVHHLEGTPSNACRTTIYTPQEIKNQFSWDWEHVPSFTLVRDWVEANICPIIFDRISSGPVPRRAT